MDPDGNVTITDRLKDMFVVVGFNAYPAEIEAILRTHDDVAQVAVVGVPDERMGEVGCAYVVPAPDRVDLGDRDAVEATGRALLGWARSAMANYKVPRSVVMVDTLPVNAGGKVLKRELRQRHAAGRDQVVTNERSN
jgi:acyl-CoA synthetase (AMP-forming)/AMP-acid ligase II